MRAPAPILVQWRAVEPAPDDGSNSPVRQVAAHVLRAEYASSFIERSDLAAELGQVPWGGNSTGNGARDPRAREAADELVAALWDEAAAIARVAYYDAGTPDHDDAVEELHELTYVIADLERTLKDRPWTEEA